MVNPHPGIVNVFTPPMVGSLTDDNLDGRVDELDDPDVVFVRRGPMRRSRRFCWLWTDVQGFHILSWRMFLA